MSKNTLIERISRVIKLIFELICVLIPFPPLVRVLTRWIPKTKKRQAQLVINLEPKAPSKTIMTQMIRPVHTDNRGVCLGGQILAWMDLCAGVCAKRHALAPCVTASVDAVHFFAPVRLGEICILKATVNRTWRTSMEVGVKVEAENMLTGDRVYCCHAYLTFVCVNGSVPIPVPAILPTTVQERRRFYEADERRAHRVAQKGLEQQKAPSPIEPIMTESTSGDTTPVPISYTGMLPEVLGIPVSSSIKTCSKSYTEIVEIVFPEHANSLGITFGGQIMKWMEYCAIMAAGRHCRTGLLIVSVDSLTFMKPTRIGDTVTIRAIVVCSFDHSVEVYCTVETQDIHGKSVMTNDGWMSVASIDVDTGVLSKVKPILAITPQEIRLQAGHRERKAKRLRDRNFFRDTLSPTKTTLEPLNVK